MLRCVVIGILAAIAVGLAIGIPTAITETPWYTRMTPVLWWNYPAWVLSSMLTGALAATYIRDRGVPVPPRQQDVSRKHAVPVRGWLPDLQQVGGHGAGHQRSARTVERARDHPLRLGGGADTRRQHPATRSHGPLGRRTHPGRVVAPADPGSRPERPIDHERSDESYAWAINGAPYPKTEPVGISEGNRVAVQLTNMTMMNHEHRGQRPQPPPDDGFDVRPDAARRRHSHSDRHGRLQRRPDGPRLRCRHGRDDVRMERMQRH